MPWLKTRLPPTPGVVRGVDPSELVVWTEHGLFRFELGPNPCVRMLHTADEAAAKFDPATGVMRWGRERYDLVGDPAAVPTTSVASGVTHEDREGAELRVDRKKRRAELVEDGKVVLTVADFPKAGDAWHFAGIVSWRTVLLVSPSGLLQYHYSDPPKPPPPPPPPPINRWEAVGAKDHAALLAAVVAAPDDDLPRLVLADWMEERGSEADVARAEFIRLQCRIAERERTAPVSDDDVDRVREAELISAHERTWRRDLPTIRGVDWVPYSGGWWRGFPSVGVQSVTTLERSYPRLVAASPVEKVVYWNNTTEARSFAALEGSRVLAGLRVLVVGGYGFEFRGELEHYRDLFTKPWLAGLRGLVLQSCSSEGLPTLAESNTLAALEWLSTSLDVEGAMVLAGATGLPHVKWVRWDRSHRTSDPEDAAVIAARHAMAKRFPHVVFNG